MNTALHMGMKLIEEKLPVESFASEFCSKKSMGACMVNRLPDKIWNIQLNLNFE